MGTARARSTTGLHLLDAQTRVELTGAPHHQDTLRWYAPPAGGPPSQVEVELLPAPIWSGAQAGWWGIEARIDGYRVGELTHPEAGWYWSLVQDVLRRGGRPGVEAHVVLDEFGVIDVELYLPVATAPTPPAAAQVAEPGRVRGHREVPLWMGVAAAALLVVMIGSVAVDRITRSELTTAAPAAADTRLSLAADTPTPSSPLPSAPTPVTTTSPAAPPAAPLAVASTKVRPKATVKRVPVVAKQKPKPSSTPKPTTTAKPSLKPEPEPEPEPTKEPTKQPTKEPTAEPEPEPESDVSEPAEEPSEESPDSTS